MKRKKWSEMEERTLLDKYAHLVSSGSLYKFKTREKKFKPIAEHVNSLHHLHDPETFPFKWSWRDVSIKVQNMRHQYLGVKQKIRISNLEFDWKDGDNHWENFLKYKEVFGDVELEVKSSDNRKMGSGDSDFLFKDCEDLGLGIDSEDLEEEDDCEDGEMEGGDNGDEGNGEVGEFGGEKMKGEVGVARKGLMKKGHGRCMKLGLIGAQVMDLRDVVVRREEKKRVREFNRVKFVLESEEKRREMEFRRETWQNEREEKVDNWEMELEEREFVWATREFERRVRLERQLDEERQKRRKIEEKREEEEMEWRERMVGMQIEHEKAVMQIQAEAFQNQMQILGVMTRLFCQFFGSANDGLGGGFAGLTPQVLQNLQHPGGLGDNAKADANSPSEFL